MVGTGAWWTNTLQPLTAGTRLQPVIYLSRYNGYMTVGSTTYEWGDFSNNTTIVGGISGIIGNTFTFPLRPQNTTWTVQVAAHVVTGWTNPPRIKFTIYKIGDPQVDLSLSYPVEGYLTLVWSYSPPSSNYPKGSYLFKRASYVGTNVWQWW